MWAGTQVVVRAGCVSSAHRTGCGQRNGWHPKQTIKMFLLWRGVPQDKDDQLSSQGKHLLTFPCSRMTKFSSCLTHLKSLWSFCRPFIWLGWSLEVWYCVWFRVVKRNSAMVTFLHEQERVFTEGNYESK